MKTIKWVVSLLTVFLLLPMLFVPVNAQDEPTFRYELSVNGQDTVEVSTGDIITVTLYLHRTDANAPYSMYAMQSEIRYDSEFFELVEDSELLASGIHSTDIAVGGSMREFYMNYVSFSGGAQWQPKTRVGSFQLRVIGTSGVSTITNEDFLVSHQDGMGGYDCVANELTVILNTECEVKFETNGGTKIDPVSVIFGEKLTRPADPIREGKLFAGWYKDIRLTQAWDFDTDTVQSNMKLYAKWIDDTTDTEPETSTEEETTEPETETSTEEETTEPETETSTEEETTEPETETSTEEETTEPDVETSTDEETSEPGTETEIVTDPGEPKDPENEETCAVCGEVSENRLCLQCSLRVYLLILFCVVLLLVLCVVLFYFMKKRMPTTNK